MPVGLFPSRQIDRKPLTGDGPTILSPAVSHRMTCDTRHLRQGVSHLTGVEQAFLNVNEAVLTLAIGCETEYLFDEEIFGRHSQLSAQRRQTVCAGQPIDVAQKRRCNGRPCLAGDLRGLSARRRLSH